MANQQNTPICFPWLSHVNEGLKVFSFKAGFLSHGNFNKEKFATDNRRCFHSVLKTCNVQLVK